MYINTHNKDKSKKKTMQRSLNQEGLQRVVIIIIVVNVYLLLAFSLLLPLSHYYHY